MEKQYYHMFANGDDARNFITTDEEFKAAFNRFAVCCVATQVNVISFSVEDSHPHGLLLGTFDECSRFTKLYESLSTRSIARRRGSLDGVRLHCELYEVTDIQYLRNVATYTIVQATKDGKAVMPYDYRYGTGPLYFRSKYSMLPWLINDDGSIATPVRYGNLTERERRRLCGSKMTDLPEEWLVCNGFILPENYVDVAGFESIYQTHNCFRAFLSSGRSKDDTIYNKMAEVRGVTIEDLEARRVCAECCNTLFGAQSVSKLTSDQRIVLARNLKRKYHLAYRQLSFLTRVPEEELRKYVK